MVNDLQQIKSLFALIHPVFFLSLYRLRRRFISSDPFPAFVFFGQVPRLGVSPLIRLQFGLYQTLRLANKPVVDTWALICSG